jgi:hypothetical protein
MIRLEQVKGKLEVYPAGLKTDLQKTPIQKTPEDKKEEEVYGITYGPIKELPVSGVTKRFGVLSATAEPGSIYVQRVYAKWRQQVKPVGGETGVFGGLIAKEWKPVPGQRSTDYKEITYGEREEVPRNQLSILTGGNKSDSKYFREVHESYWQEMKPVTEEKKGILFTNIDYIGWEPGREPLRVEPFDQEILGAKVPSTEESVPEQSTTKKVLEDLFEPLD